MEVFLKYDYLSSVTIKGFDRYKYSSIDTSPIGKYVSHPFWNTVVEFIPRWIAPNSLTLAGFLFLVVSVIFETYYDISFYASADEYPDIPTIPNWVWLFLSFSQFMSHTLDGCDGKQARRTGSSSPLGELFDHGLDSWATLLMPMGLYCIFGRGQYGAHPIVMYYVLIAIYFGFVLSHWEKYLTGVLFLPWSYDASQWGVCLVYLITYLGTYKIWQHQVPFLEIKLSILLIGLMCFFIVFFAFPMSIYNIYISWRAGTGKNRSFYEAAKPWLSIVVLFGVSLYWVHFSPNDILTTNPRLMFFACGTVFANMTTYLIINQMSDTLCNLFHWMLIPLLVTVFLIFFTPFSAIELQLTWIYVLFTNFAHIHYGANIVRQLCDHLNIYAFSIEKPGPKKD